MCICGGCKSCLREQGINVVSTRDEEGQAEAAFRSGFERESERERGEG